MEAQFPHLPELVSGSNRPLEYTFAPLYGTKIHKLLIILN